jgi:hypothetical protein
MAEYTAPEVAAVTGLVDTYLQWRDKNGPPRGYERYHPSAFGNCLRLMQYQRFAERGYIEWPKEEKKPDLLRIFGNGHSMHDRWRSYFDEIGVLRGYWQCENPLCAAYDENEWCNPDGLREFKEDPRDFYHRRRWYGKDQLQGCFRPERCVCGGTNFHYDEIDVKSEELNFYGHCDMILDFSRFDPKKFDGVRQSYLPEYLPTRPVVVDMKSINMFGFQDVQSGKEEHKDYLVQLTIYANILDCDYGILIYENKNNSKIHALKVEKNSDVWWEEVKRQAKMMNDGVDVVDEDGTVHHLLPPPRPLSPESNTCQWCLFKDRCMASGAWDDPELNQKRREFYGELL